MDEKPLRTIEQSSDTQLQAQAEALAADLRRKHPVNRDSVSLLAQVNAELAKRRAARPLAAPDCQF